MFVDSEKVIFFEVFILRSTCIDLKVVVKPNDINQLSGISSWAFKCLINWIQIAILTFIFSDNFWQQSKSYENLLLDFRNKTSWQKVISCSKNHSFEWRELFKNVQTFVFNRLLVRSYNRKSDCEHRSWRIRNLWQKVWRWYQVDRKSRENSSW